MAEGKWRTNELINGRVLTDRSMLRLANQTERFIRNARCQHLPYTYLLYPKLMAGVILPSEALVYTCIVDVSENPTLKLSIQAGAVIDFPRNFPALDDLTDSLSPRSCRPPFNSAEFSEGKEMLG